MTKIDAVKLFKEIYSNELNSLFKTDKPGKREAWINFVDMLCRDGDISERQAASWDQPKFISN